MSGHPIPVAALAAHLAILGKTGAGKSYAARSTVEGILARGERACIIDPTGVWWGLRLDADGKPRGGYPVVIAGGRHGDVPVTGEDGQALARIVGGSATPLIVDTSTLTVSARTELFTAFAEGLLVENVGPLHVVVDEAHLFAPQGRVPDPRSAMMLHAANGLVALGRARGLRVMLLSQRPAKLHKDALTQVETLVAMRFTAPQDRKAVEAWIVDQADRKRGAEIVASLPTLKQGEGWVWSPDADLLERVAFPAIATFDSMRPEAQGTRALTPIDVAAVRAALVTVSDADGASDTKIKGGSKKSTGSGRADDKTLAAEVAAAERRGYERGYAEGEAASRDRTQVLISGGIADLAADLDELARRLRSLLDVAPPTARITVDLPAERSPAPKFAPRSSGATAEGVSPPRQRILDAIAWAGATGQPAPSRAVVAFLAGVTHTSGGFRNNLGALSTAGLIRYPSPGAVGLTEAGEAAASPPATALDHAAMMTRVAGVLAPALMRLVGAVATVHPEAIPREDLAAATGVTATSGGFRNNLGRLSTLGLVTYPAPGFVRAADLLFPDRRPVA